MRISVFCKRIQPAMYIFFDTETADLPRRWDAPAADIRNWPRVVQLAWIACDSKGKCRHIGRFT